MAANSLEIDVRSEPDGRVSMNRFTFSLLLGLVKRPPSWWRRGSVENQRLMYQLNDELNRVWEEAYPIEIRERCK